jgi:membrane-bound lytic murein transglycosylase B
MGNRARRFRAVGFLALGWLMTGPVGAAPRPQPPDPVAKARFEDFVRDFRATALDSGIAAQTYDRSMAGISLNPRVQQLNLQQPEFIKPVWEYLDGAVSADRIAKGQQMMAAEATPLANIEQRFGVPREILVAIWGIESDYGTAMGSFNMFEALSTLAYDGPRSEFARRELINAMKMEEREHYDPSQMTSSWASAFGQTQFVPSSFLEYAVDGDGDGKVDLWRSSADALASSANLLENAGWEKGATWGYEIALPASFPFEDANIDSTKSLSEWRKLGVTAASGTELSKSDAQAAVIVPAGARGPAFLVFDNFRVVLKYNNAVSYALAVCELADRLKGGAPILHTWPRDEVALTRDELVAFQYNLKKLGYEPGEADGIFGRKAKAALRAYQKAQGLPADGFATQGLLVRMERDVVAKGS